MLGGRYRLDQLLGRGSTAEVWRAFDVRLERPVAVKRLIAGGVGDPTTAARLEREARTVAGLSHPGIVTVYDTGIEDGMPWLAMELVDGESLADLLAREGRVDPRRAVAVAIQVARALQHAHEAGLVHRDVKPANIMLRADGRAQVVDFGITTGGDDARLTSAGMVVGSAAYLAPEVAAGNPASPASDVYSLSAVLFEMITGEPPFTGSNLPAVLLAHQQQAPPSVSRSPDAPPWLDRVISRGMDKDPRRRHESAGTFADDLAQGERGSRVSETMAMPVVTPPASTAAMATGSEAPVPPRRSKARLVAALVAALALVMLTAWALGGRRSDEDLALDSTPTTSEITVTTVTESTAVPTTADPGPGVAERIAEVRDQIVGAVEASPIKNKTSKDLVEKIDDAVDAFQEEKVDEAKKDLEQAYDTATKIDIPVIEGLIQRAIEQLAGLMGFQLDGR